MTPSEHTVTQLLRAWSAGDRSALDTLVPAVEAELRRLARIYMSRERREHTLQPTALVNEVFLKLVDAADVRWQDRAHFFGISARLMRRVLVDHARARGYHKRGGDVTRVTLDGQDVAAPDNPIDVIALDRARRTGSGRRTEVPGRGDAVLRGIERRGDCGGTRRLG